MTFQAQPHFQSKGLIFCWNPTNQRNKINDKELFNLINNVPFDKPEANFHSRAAEVISSRGYRLHSIRRINIKTNQTDETDWKDEKARQKNFIILWTSLYAFLKVPKVLCYNNKMMKQIEYDER